MGAPLFSIQKGALNGAVWDGKYGHQPTFRKGKRNKEGRFEKDENGKQLYSDFYNQNDLWDLVFIVTALHDWMVKNPAPKDEEF